VRRRLPLDPRAIGVFVVVAIVTLVANASVFLQPDPADFRSFYLAARAVYRHLDPYDPVVLLDLNRRQPAYPYLYSPLLASIAIPLTRLELLTAFRLWSAGSIAAFGLVAALTVATRSIAAVRVAAQRPLVGLLAILVVGAALGSSNMIHSGQVNSFVLVPLVASFVLARRRPGLAGGCLAVAGLLKTSPVIVVFLFVAERRWRALLAAAVTALGIAGLTTLRVGVRGWERFFDFVDRTSRLEPIVGLFAYSAPPNFSLVGVVTRLTHDDLVTSRMIAGGVSLALLAPILVLAARRRDVERGRAGLVLSILVVMVVSSPLAYVHHVIYVLPGVVWLLLLGLGLETPSLGALNLAALLGLWLVGLLARA
jgi:alpha-1,2-mannosyltransferase